MSSLYVEIIDKNRSYYKCTICGRKLSKKQRLKTHLSCVPYHKPITILNAITNRNLPSFLQEKDATLGIIRNTRKFPVYQYQNQQSLIVTIKRSASRSNTTISIPQSVVSTELKAVVPRESSASHRGETLVQETEATIYDYKGALEFWSTNGSALYEAFLSLDLSHD